MTRTLPWLVLTTTLLFSISPLKATFFNNSLASQCLNSATALTVVNLTDILNDSEGHKSSIILAKNEPPFRLRTIVIDAGHGGHDPGCLGAGYYEKHLALELSQAFAQKVREQYPDIQVIMTRDKDVFIPLHERASIANQANADLFISIHCNAMPPGNSGTAGTETFVMGLHTAEHNLDVAKRENASILLEDNYERNYDYDPNSPEGHILLSMFQNAYLEQSILFAERVEHHFHNTAERKSRGVKQAGFVVLKETAMPSVLVEAGFLTNKKDEAFLRSEEGQELVATSLLNALTDYKAILEGQPVETFAANPPAAVASPPAFQPEPEPVQSYIPPSVPATPPTSKTYESPAVYTHTPPSVQQQTGAVRAEPTIQPTPAQGTIIQSVPAQDRALQPRGKGDTSWAENIGREPSSAAVAGLIYCVQLAASPRPLNTRINPWTNSSFLIEVLQEEEMYKYQVRNFTQLTAATNVKYTVQQQGFPDAFVVAYHNGQRISLEQAKALTTGQR